MDELCDNARPATPKRIANAFVEHLEGHCPVFVAAQNDEGANVLLAYLFSPRSDNDDGTETQIVLVIRHRNRGREEAGVGITRLVTVPFGRRSDVAEDTLPHHGFPFAAR